MTTSERESLDALAEMVIGAAYEVANTLGAGFLEKVYELAQATELRLRGIIVETQSPFIVRYKGEDVGTCFADVLVDRLIVEVKCAEAFGNEHLAQTLNYLKATDLRLGLLINFQKPKVEWRRIVYRF
jgi:GxxExxY protein